MKQNNNNLKFKWSIIAPHYNSKNRIDGYKKIIADGWAVNEASAKHQAYTKMSIISVNKYPNNPYFLRCIIEEFSEPHYVFTHAWPVEVRHYKIEPKRNSLVQDTKALCAVYKDLSTDQEKKIYAI